MNNAVLGTLGNTVLTFPMRRALLLREYKNGTFSLVPWYVAWMISTSLINFIHVLLMGLPVYFMVGLRLDGVQYFLIFFSALLILAIIGSGAGMIIGAMSKDVQSASAMVLPTLVPLMLFSGYILPYASLKVYFKPFYFISFFQWALNLLEKNQFTGFIFPDCEARTLPNPLNPAGPHITRNCFKDEPVCIQTCFVTGDECVSFLLISPSLCRPLVRALVDGCSPPLLLLLPPRVCAQVPPGNEPQSAENTGVAALVVLCDPQRLHGRASLRRLLRRFVEGEHSYKLIISASAFVVTKAILI